MTGAIPPYGEHFRLESHLRYDTFWAGRRYVLKADPRYWIRADKSSEHWYVFAPMNQRLCDPWTEATPLGRRAFDTLTLAMDWLRRLHALMQETEPPTA